MNEDINENETILEIYSPRQREEFKECDNEMTSLQQQPANYSFCDRLRRKLSIKNGLLMTATAAFIGGCVYANNQMIMIDENEQKSSRQLHDMGFGDVAIKRPSANMWAIAQWLPGTHGESCTSVCNRNFLWCSDEPYTWPGRAHQITALEQRFSCSVEMLQGSIYLGPSQDTKNNAICYSHPNGVHGLPSVGLCAGAYKNANRLCWCWNMHAKAPVRAVSKVIGGARSVTAGVKSLGTAALRKVVPAKAAAAA